MKVLLVDDESLIRMDMRDILEAAGHEVVGEGKNGVEALALVPTLKPDVVLMDVKMPELDGIEAARQLRRLHIAPVVLLTAYSQQDLVEKAMSSGVFGYLIKPVREEQILPTLHLAMSRFQEEERLYHEREGLERALEERKMITRATGILMDTHGLTEEIAYKKIRSYSMAKGKTIVEVCQAIITSARKKQR